MTSAGVMQWFVYQQDYLWFLVLLGWAALVPVWSRQDRAAGSLRWMPWAAAAGMVTAALEIARMLTPAESRPWLTPWVPWELALSAAVALWASGWWWELAVRNGAGWSRRAAAGIIVVVCASVSWRLVYHATGACVAVGVLSLAGIALGGQRHTPRAERIALAALILSGWLGTSGPLAVWFAAPRNTDISALGPWSALAQLVAAGALAVALNRRALADLRSDEQLAAEWRQLLRVVGLWLVAGLLLAAAMGRWTRANFERSLLSRATLSAALIDSRELARILGPSFRLNRVRNWRTAAGRTAQVYRSDYWATGVLDPFAVALTRIELANPDARWALILTMRDSRLVIACNSTRLADHLAVNGVFGPASETDWEQWAERRADVLGPIDFYYGDIVQARAPIVAPNGAMLGWLALDVGVAHWVAAQAQARLPMFVVVALGAALLVINWRQRVRERQRAAAHRDAEAAVAASRLKSAFLAKVSHELRTPIQSLLGYSELLRQRIAGDSKAAGWLGSLRQQGELMTRLVNDLIDLGAIEAGAFQLAARAVAPAEVVSQMVESFRPRAEAKGLSLACFVADDVPRWVSADGERLRQVVSNLVGNAIKFTACGSVTVALRAEPEVSAAAEITTTMVGRAAPGFGEARDGRAGVRLILTVRDTGPGIPPAEQGRLFAAFSRLDATADQEGSGLGLALSTALCRAMGGSLTVESDGSSGSTFVGTFRAEPISGPAGAAGAAPPAQLRGYRVLVVDDNPLVRDLFVAFLTEQGALCASAATGNEALAHVAASGFDVAVLDLALPDLDGAELARRLRARFEADGGLRLVGVSAHAGASDRARALAAGMDAFLTKPVALGELAAAVADVAFGGSDDSPAFATRDALRERLSRQFQFELPEQRAQLAAAIAARDWSRVRALAHYLKNSAVVVEDDALFVACCGLEETAESAEERVIQARWARCEQALERWSEPHASPISASLG